VFDQKSTGRPVVSIVHPKHLFPQLYDERTMERIAAVSDLKAAGFESKPSAEEMARLLEGAHVAITSWGTPTLSAEVLERASELRLVIHAAGSVKPIVSDALFARGIRVTSGAAVIGRGVAETTLGLMITASKDVYGLREATARGAWSEARQTSQDFCDITVGVVGCGHVGRHLIQLLGMFDVEVLVYDPYLSEEEAGRLGATKCELDDLLRRSHIVSLHAPSIPETRHMINQRTLALIRDGGILINTARGSLINEADLIREVESGRIRAFLDVTDPEPPAPDHPFRTLPGVVLTPHIAGVATNGRKRLGRYALAEIERFINGEPPLYEVREEQLPRIA